jgi:hypothetical protein
VPEGHNDLRPVRPGAKILDDPLAQIVPGIAGEHRDALGVEEDHARPADQAASAVARRELDHEEIALVVESVRDVVEIRQSLAAKRLQELQVLLAALESLLHRDHAVSEHSGLGHSYVLSPKS